jgi:hypothetical protein
MEPLEGEGVGPRQVRYQAALRPDIENLLILLHSPTAHVTFASLFGRKLYQNCTKTHPACPKPPHLHSPCD